MNKTSPKKIMEIIFIFILPLLIIAANITYTYEKTEYTDPNTPEITQIHRINYIEYDAYLVEDSPIRNVLEIPFELLGINTESYMTNIIIDYNALWFTNFIIWHLLYLFFDTIMHKVLLRKE